jgi:methylated-DNA-[protein]-cysteine S-methyltransferase
MLDCIIETPLGNARIEGNAKGIRSLCFLNSHVTPSATIPNKLKPCVQQLNEYFNRERKTFDLKLDLKGTEFQKKVWQLLLTLPYGNTVSYLKLAQQFGDRKALRAVANANARNPIWIVIPCHRVIGSNGNLTGYAGGLPRKKWLLQHEGALLQQSLFS